MAAAVLTRHNQPERGGKASHHGTPEVYFQKAIDNSRLVKVDDPQRAHEHRVLVAALVIAFALVMTYAWQHMKSIQYGYQIETLKTQRATLENENSQLRLEESSLTNPERIEAEAARLGLQDAEPGQIILLDAATTRADGGAVMAKATHYSVISTP